MQRFLQCLLLLLFLLTGNKIAGQNMDYGQFKTGKFQMIYDNKTAVIFRTASVQTELIAQSHITATYNVTWINPHTYTLTPTAATLYQFPEMAPDLVITVQILKITKKTCTIQTSSNLFSKVIKGEMLKMD